MTGQARADAGLDTLIEEWERQQEGYVSQREQRFGIVADALQHSGRAVWNILDLGAGTGAFSRRLLDRFPEAHVWLVDNDPALLTLARHALREDAGRVHVIETDLLDPQWPERLDVVPDAAVSSTALHWLSPRQLVELYGRLGGILPEGGWIFDADHFRGDRPGTRFEAVSAVDDERQQAAAFGAGAVPDWDGWWRRLRELDGFAELIDERDRRFSRRERTGDASVGFHVEALRAAGFGEAGTLWQYFDDYVVYGVR